MSEAPEHHSHPPPTPEHPRLYVEVAVSRVLPGATRGVFTYHLPDDMGEDVERGLLVVVPMQKRHVPGLVLRVTSEAPAFETRPLHAVPEPRVVLAPERLETAEWLARECASSVYSAASLFLPPGLQTRLIDVYRVSESPAADSGLTHAQRKVVALLRAQGAMTIDQLRSATGSSLATVMDRLEALGAVTREVRVDQHVPGPRIDRYVRLLDDDATAVARAPKQAAILEHLVDLRRFRRDGAPDLVALADLRDQVDVDTSALAGLERKGLVEVVELPRSQAPVPRPAPAPVLTVEQAAAWSTLERALAAGESTPHLLFGVTGSGKTEIYLRGVAWCLRHRRAAIVLVPEIGLATQVVRRFVDRFPGQVVVLHSQLTESQRYEIWQGIASGEYPVVVGPRSALFAPVRDLGLIVLDEEHESTYKQDSEPRYQARLVAQRVAAQAGAALVFGSATPSVESAWHAERGDYQRIVLPERVNPLGSREGGGESLELPEVEVVDLKRELQDGHTGLLSRRLTRTVQRALDRGEQAIVLLNRRGTSTVVLCRACGHRVTCPFCEIPLVFHGDRRQMVCHRCDHREPPPQKCPDCLGRLDYFGAGTQRVEEEVHRAFPQARILRWDQDSVRRQGGYEQMLGRVERHEVDIVVGTQMVAKGFDLPKVTAIGVVQADTMLHLPDFRSGERTFQLLTQVAGRAGRRASGSRVVVQTYTPDHYAIAAAAKHDYDAFYAEEIDFRERHLFPPFVRLARYLYRHEQERSAAVEAEMMAREIARHARQLGISLDLLGPTPAFMAKLRGKYQWQIVLRSRSLEALLDDLPIRPGWVVDIDPQSML